MNFLSNRGFSWPTSSIMSCFVSGAFVMSCFVSGAFGCCWQCCELWKYKKHLRWLIYILGGLSSGNFRIIIRKNLPLQTPDIHILSSHSALSPHLHDAELQVSDVWLEHLGFAPHMQVPTLQLSDNPSQSLSPEHSKTLMISKIYTHIRPNYTMF